MSPRALLYTRVGNLSRCNRSLYVKLWKPGRIFVARLWTPSSASTDLTLYGLHTVWAYSRWLRTRALYSSRKLWMSRFLKQRSISPSILFAVLTFPKIWFSNWRSDTTNGRRRSLLADRSIGLAYPMVVFISVCSVDVFMTKRDKLIQLVFNMKV